MDQERFSLKSERTVHFNDHEILIAFNDDIDAEKFHEWWSVTGEKLLVEHLESKGIGELEESVDAAIKAVEEAGRGWSLTVLGDWYEAEVWSQDDSGGPDAKYVQEALHKSPGTALFLALLKLNSELQTKNKQEGDNNVGPNSGS